MKLKDISPRWFWLPFLIVLAQLLARYYSPDIFERYFEGENGLIELTTSAVLLPGIVFGMMALRLHRHLPNQKALVWVILVTTGAIYMAGEELSWGQWLFYWDTPEAYIEFNDQHETNLHNTSSWLDQKPRLILELWALFGAFYAWWRHVRGLELDIRTAAYWFWPTLPLAWTGLFSALTMMPERVRDWWGTRLGSPFDIRVTETQELVLAFFLTYFLASAWIRLRSLSGEQRNFA